jgi:hypothetical protein
MEQADSFEFMTQARFSATHKLKGDPALRNPTHQSTRFAGGV